MPEYLDDPSVLTKDKLKSELLAHNVDLPSGNPTKDVYVQLYLKELTSQNAQPSPDTLDAFSSDEELPPPPLSDRNRSSAAQSHQRNEGRLLQLRSPHESQHDRLMQSKRWSRINGSPLTRFTLQTLKGAVEAKMQHKSSKKVLLGELDVTMLTDQSLRDELLIHGLDAGPIVASTRKLYEKRLQKLLDNDPPTSQVILADTKVTSNGSADPELYSDQDDEVTETPAQTEMAPEPVPVLERPLRSRGKGPLTAHAQNLQHTTVEKIAASEQTVSLEKEDVLKELLHSDLSSPTGISATCRRPIKGAAERPVTSSQLWNESLLFSPLATQTASVVENRITNRLAGVPRSSGLNSSPSRPVFAPPSAGQSKALSRGTFPWVKLLLLAVLAALFFFIYQTMEPNSISPFNVAEVGGARDENP
ncbi:Lamina-associated polypeptide 2, isoforms beta/gamma [Takifugu flavidus]|uniref:Lamina-associated polypeptide 2, isoforms beta/gamma n=1 Tax=Takifugu flavidus TaxID=433684 RepID=A0A5C6ND32_9TELE|nr:Lamina-associated polypeptide 2, isoforms beta/gamma [Takifugu flavidus]